MDENRFALIVASNQYEDPDLSNLIAPAQDAESLASVLADRDIGSFNVQKLMNMPSHEVLHQIEVFFIDRKRNDLLLLYLSCHGIKDKGGQLYFATVNTERKFLRATAIPASFVNDVMHNSLSRQQVLILDCCYSGAFAKGLVVRADKEVNTGNYFKEGQGQVILTASDSMQYAFEEDELKEGEPVHSIFTETLIQGLKSGEADVNRDGSVSFDDVYNYVRDRVTMKMPQQEPRKWEFNVKGEIIIARNPKPVAIELPPEIKHAMESPLPNVQAGVVKELGKLLVGSHKGYILAAREALERLCDEDSRMVSKLASECLAKYDIDKSDLIEKIESHDQPSEITDEVETEPGEDKVLVEAERKDSVKVEPPELSGPPVGDLAIKKSKNVFGRWLLGVLGVVVAILMISWKTGCITGTWISIIYNLELREQGAHAKELAKKYGFFASDGKPWSNSNSDGFPNKFRQMDNIVRDDGTGLMWQREGSQTEIGYNQISGYLREINAENFGGYSDWRLPSLVEAWSLLESKQTSQWVYIDPMFNPTQSCIWTKDETKRGYGWFVYISSGIPIFKTTWYSRAYVRAVRGPKFE